MADEATSINELKALVDALDHHRGIIDAANATPMSKAARESLVRPALSAMVELSGKIGAAGHAVVMDVIFASPANQ